MLKKQLGLILVPVLVSAFFLVIPSSVRAATYTVTKTADTSDGTCDADCSLREAVAAANANSGADTVEFNIPTSDGGYNGANDYFLITATSTIILSDDAGVYINGYSQPTASRNVASFGQSLNTNLVIKISFSSGFLSLTGDNNHITGLNLTRSASGTVVFVDGSSENWIEGNYFGSDINGLSADGGGEIGIANSSENNVIGTDGDGTGDTGELNLVTGSSDNNGLISFTASNGNKISGNYIGVNATGRVCTNGTIRRNAVMLQSTVSEAQIGTNYDGVSDDNEGNIIGCVNTDARGVLRINSTSNSVIQGNYIGTNPYGDSLSDFTIPGLIFRDSASSNVTVKGNTIAHNNGAGIAAAFSASSGLTFIQNRLFDNSGHEIDLGNDGVTANDSGDADSGANDLMNFPVIEWAEYEGNDVYRVHGSLDGNASEGPWTIEVCQSSRHSSGYGGCLQTLGTTSLAVGEIYWTVTGTISGNNAPDALSAFTALATNANGSTSEFSANVQATLPPNAPPAEPAPDIRANESGVVSRGAALAMVQPMTFPWESKLTVNTVSDNRPFHIPGTMYWQASPMYEIWFKAFFNDARILPDEVRNPFVLALNYDPTKLESVLPEKNLKLAYSEDEGKVWSVLSNSVLDQLNNTVAVVTKDGGWYMLVSGYVTSQPASQSNTPKVQSATITSDHPATEPSPAPTPSPVPAPPSAEPTPTGKPCTRFLFWCI